MKPSNILVRDGRPCADRGLRHRPHRRAGAADPQRPGHRHTRRTSRPSWRVARSPRPASDVWALGVSLYAAVEGEPPYPEQANAIALLNTIAVPGPADPAARWSAGRADRTHDGPRPGHAVVDGRRRSRAPPDRDRGAARTRTRTQSRGRGRAGHGGPGGGPAGRSAAGRGAQAAQHRTHRCAQGRTDAGARHRSAAGAGVRPASSTARDPAGPGRSAVARSAGRRRLVADAGPGRPDRRRPSR